MANNLEKYRGAKGLTQEELGKMVGMTKQAVSHHERNALNPDNAIKFAEVLGVNVFELMGDDVLLMKPANDKDKKILKGIIDSL